MNYSIAPDYASQAQDDYERRCADSDELDARRTCLATDFTIEFLTKDMRETSEFGSMFSAYAGHGKGFQMRKETVGEIAYSSVDTYHGLTLDDVFTFVASEAKSGNQKALYLVEQMAAAYAKQKVDA